MLAGGREHMRREQLVEFGDRAPADQGQRAVFTLGREVQRVAQRRRHAHGRGRGRDLQQRAIHIEEQARRRFAG